MKQKTRNQFDFSIDVYYYQQQALYSHYMKLQCKLTPEKKLNNPAHYAKIEEEMRIIRKTLSLMGIGIDGINCTRNLDRIEKKNSNRFYKKTTVTKSFY